MAFSITSAVERVLTIIELVDLICEHSPRCPRYGTTEWTQWSIYSFIDASSPGVSSYGALPVLARTTRFLSKRALRVLWGRLDSFWPLLRLLPCDLLDVGEGPSYLVEQSRPEYEPLRTPQQEDFVRYIYYAQFVQYISCAQEEMLPQHTFDILASSTAPIFPRLRRLQFLVPGGALHRSQYYHFLHPTLRELILHDNCHINVTMDSFLRTVKQKCSKLRVLQVVRYWFQESDYEVDAALGQCLISLANITVLSISVTCRGVGRALLLLESHLQRLVHLTLFLVDGNQPPGVNFPPNPVSLSNLTSLSFFTPFPHIVLTPFVPPPKLEALHIRSQGPMDEEVWAATSDAIADFAKELTSVREVLVSDYHPFHADENDFAPEVSKIGLGPLLNLRLLNNVCIATTIYISPTPALLQSVLDAWKDQLELFILSPIAYLLADPVPPVTLQDVIKFAFKCPKMVRVGMLFNAKRPTLTSTAEGEADEDEFYDVPTAPHVRELMAGAAWIDDIDYVVRLLKHGFPCLRRIDWADSDTYLAMPEDRAKNWELVEERMGLGP